MRCVENEVDGDGFLALTTDMVKCLIPALGPQAKFLMKHQELRDSLVSHIY